MITGALTGGLLAESAAEGEKGTAVFPFGTHIYSEPPLPMEQLRADLPLLKRLGFTMVKIQESWSADERREGHVDLSKVASLVSDARQNGLLVYFGITMEQAPAWLWKKYPDCQMLWETGEPFVDPTQYLLSNDGKPGPCWNHPGARAAGTRFVEAVGREIGKFDNVLVWNVWQEVALDFTYGANHLGLCYCPNTLHAFRTWLIAKYLSLKTLNQVWRTAYADWEEVDPPRRFTKVPSMVDWGYFMENVYLADGLRWKAEAFRRSDPGKRKILAHTGSPRYGGSADWRLARQLDIYGASCYPGWGEYQDPDVSDEVRLLQSDSVRLQLLDNALRWDYIRGASPGREFWTAELQGGRAGGGVNPGRVPDPADIRRWVLGGLAGGVHGICFWNHRSEPFWDEAYGFGLMELKGGETPRAREAGRIAKAINEKAADLISKGQSARATVGIVIDEDLWNFVKGSGDPLKSNFSSNLRGIHAALFQEGFPTDFLDAADVKALGSKYKVLIHPFPLALGTEAITSLKEYVHSGGTLISGACPGRFDRFGFGMAGEMPPALTELFGVEHRQLLSLAGRSPHPSQSSVNQGNVAALVLNGAGEFANERLRAEFYLQYLRPSSATPILKYKSETVGSSHRFGAGTAILIGTLPGVAVAGPDGGDNQRFLGSLLKAQGLAPDREGTLIRRRRIWGSQAAWFLFNMERHPVESELALGTFRKASDLLGGDLAVQNGSVSIRVGPMDIACVLLEA